jgi:hypothetical protein
LKFFDFLFVNLDRISVLGGHGKVISRVVKGSGYMLLVILYLQVESAGDNLRCQEREVEEVRLLGLLGGLRIEHEQGFLKLS